MSAAAPTPRGSRLLLRQRPVASPFARERAAIERIAAMIDDIVERLAGVRPGTRYEGAVPAAGLAPPALVGKVAAADAAVSVALSRAFAFDFVEAATGGDGTQAPLREERTASTAEKALLGIFLSALAQALADVSTPRQAFSVARLEADATTLAREAPAVALAFSTRLFGRDGGFWLTIPDDARDEFARLLGSDAGAAGSTPDWRGAWRGALARTEVAVTAVVRERRRLGEFTRLARGDTLRLSATSRTRPRVLVEGAPRFAGELGQEAGRYTLRILAPADATRQGDEAMEKNETAPEAAGGALARLLDIPVTLDVVLGAARMQVCDLMKLAPGAVVPLDRRIGEPVDVVINGRLVARGEIVVVEDDPERLGVVLGEIVAAPSP